MKRSRIPLEGRVDPVQSRAKESVDRILAAAGPLLDEVGIEGFNTNLLAERAGVRIRTVYRYFPNKYAVIMALTLKLSVEWDKWMAQTYGQIADPRADWRAALRRSKLRWLRSARRVPGALSVLQAINATPELNALHSQIYEGMSQKFAEALTARGLRVRPGKLRAIARTLVNLSNSGTDVYLRLSGAEAREFVDEMSLSEVKYLEHYLGTLTEPARPARPIRTPLRP